MNASNKVVVGNLGVTSIGGQVGWTTYSDRRLKKDIQESNLGLAFILNLKPVTYEYIAAEQAGIRYTGLIAQDVDAAAKGAFSGVDKNGEYWGIRYAELTVPLVKAVQEQAAGEKAQDSKIATLEAENHALKNELTEIRSMMTQLSTDLQACCFKSQEATKTNPSYTMSFTDTPVLNQNVPNPFDQNTTIQFYIPQTVKAAQMQVSDMNGRVVKTQDISTKGFGMMTIEAGNLAAGSYLYTLVLDGKAFDSKKMILTTR